MQKSHETRLDLRVVIAFIVELIGVGILIALPESSFPDPLFIVALLLIAGTFYPIVRASANRRRFMMIYGFIIVAGAGTRMMREMARYGAIDEQPVVARAVVLDTGHYPAKVHGGKRWVEYSYNVNGTAYTGKEYAPPCAPGDTILIRYAASDPGTSLPVREEGMGDE